MSQNTIAIRVEGGIFPPTIFDHIRTNRIGDSATRTAQSYHLVGNESVRDAANRSWSYLSGAWEAWRTALEEEGGEGSFYAAMTRDRWLLQLFSELGFGRVPTTTAITIGETTYPVSHMWQHLPIHLLGPGIDLDKSAPGVPGAARAPQAMLQEFLNRSEAHLWGFISNGRQLRLLRDSTALAGSAYVEFDLEAIFGGELFAEFLLMWQLCHVSRFEIPIPEDPGIEPAPTDCIIEAWRADAVKTGNRALDTLRDGVESALVHLGNGFLTHPENDRLRSALRNLDLRAEDYHRHLLRLVYRLLFLFVTEDRGVLLDPAAPEQARSRYEQYFSTARLRETSRRSAGSSVYGDLWEAQRLVLSSLGGEGESTLGLPPLGGLFDPENGADSPLGADPLLDLKLSNTALLAAVRDLAWLQVKRGHYTPVDYRHLGAEELGSVYESLLELVPQISAGGEEFTLTHFAGNERKTTGSYYTPPGLVSALLDSALDPVISDAVKKAADTAEAEENLLSLAVCDPACGSGHFLVAAARRIARRLASIRSREEEPTPDQVRHAVRDVIGRCIYGVDINPLAAELAKVSLWLEAVEPGKPLGFLDARIRVGNSLLGTTPMLLSEAVPAKAFDPLEGDDKAFAREVKRRNTKETAGRGAHQGQLGFDFDADATRQLAAARQGLLGLHDDVEQVREQRRRWRRYEQSEGYLHAKLHADAWVAAFMWPLRPDPSGQDIAEGVEIVPEPPTTSVVAHIGSNPGSAAYLRTRGYIARLAEEYGFFHWNLEFPEVFNRGQGEPGPQGWTGGFDCMIGNPPWERVKLQEKEYFAGRDDDIATAGNAAKRNRLIKALATSDSAADRSLHADFLAAKRRAETVSLMLRTSGVYPLAGRGDINTYQVFTEMFRNLTGPFGQAGLIVPTGIATDATTQHFFRDLVETKSIAMLYDFENAVPTFDGVHRSFKFCLLTMTGRNRDVTEADFAFFLHDPRDIDSVRFKLTPEEITLLNPNTGTLPVFRARRDAEITLGIYRRVPVLIKEGDPDGNPWGVSFMRMFDMSNDSHLFRERAELEDDGWTLNGNVFEKFAPDGTLKRMLPLYESKMLHQFDHRWATYEKDGSVRLLESAEKRSSSIESMPEYWVPEDSIFQNLQDRWDHEWLIGWRKLARATDERTLISFFFPRAGLGDSGNLIVGEHENIDLLHAVANSFVVDFVSRLKVGGSNFNFFHFAQLPFVTPLLLSMGLPAIHTDLVSWLRVRQTELVGTGQAVVAALSLANGYSWDQERRMLLRSELDGLLFQLYGIRREDVEYIMETFPIVKRKDFAEYGEYRTKRLILEVYDAMQHAIDTGTEYKTVLDPPPGQGPRHELTGVAVGGTDERAG